MVIILVISFSVVWCWLMMLCVLSLRIIFMSYCLSFMIMRWNIFRIFMMRLG